MKNKIQTSQNIFDSMRQEINADHHFLTPSIVGNKSNEVGVSCKEVSFVVEWQMHNPTPEFSLEK
jgi:hypothetical protein